MINIPIFAGEPEYQITQHIIFFKLLAATPKSNPVKRLVVYGRDTYDVWAQEPARILELCFHAVFVIHKITKKNTFSPKKSHKYVTFSGENVTFSE